MDSVRAAYDAVAPAYADTFMHELDDRPLERSLLRCFAAICTRRSGTVADIGCGPGHVTSHLARHGLDVVGLDLSPRMIEEARKRSPRLEFRVGSMTALDEADDELSGIVALYSIIHLEPGARKRAFGEFARVIEPGGLLLISFHVSAAEYPSGSAVHLETWFDQAVDLTGYFLAPDEVVAELEQSGFQTLARLEREPSANGEYPSRRCYLLARR